jgi:predicted glycosyltransferase involved in capsule biosynthesis
MEIFNSIFITLRDRKKYLSRLLESIEISMSKATQQHEIVIVDLGTNTYDVDELVDNFRKSIPIKVIKTGYTGIFHKSKALNCGVKNSRGFYISLLDADSLVPVDYIIGIEDFFRNQDNSRVKLCHRVVRVNPKETQQILSSRITAKYLNSMAKRPASFMMYLERFTEKEITKREIKIKDRALMTQALGNSHFTMQKQNYLDIGGYNEEFIGWGCEDKEFNLRYYRYFKNGTIRDDARYMCFSLTCKQESDWRRKSLHNANLERYNNTVANKEISCLPIHKGWGEF